MEEMNEDLFEEISPKTFVGVLSEKNRNAIDWGVQGLIAYGCQNVVAIVEPKTVQMIQTLEGHKSEVTIVRWSRENYHHDLSNPYSLRVASCDVTGVTFIWNVQQGKTVSTLSDEDKTVQCIEWLWNQDMNRDLLLTLNDNKHLILWNAETGSKLWKKSFQEGGLLSITLDPFDPEKLSLLRENGVMLLDDFAAHRCPPSNGKSFVIACQGQPLTRAGSNQSISSGSSGDPKQSSRPSRRFELFERKGKDTKKDAAEPEPPSLNNGCLQAVYHPHQRNILLLLFSQEILFIDTEIQQSTGGFGLERVSSPMVRVIPCSVRDVLYCLHQNGTVSLRVRRRESITSPGSPDVAYKLSCQSEVVRNSPNSRIWGVALSPLDQCQVAAISSDGRLLLWELVGAAPSSPTLPPCVKSLLHLLHTTPNAPPLRFLLVGLLRNLGPPPFVIRMNPTFLSADKASYRPWVAAGNSAGVVQLLDVHSRQMINEIRLSNYPVRGIEWIDVERILVWSYPQTHSNSAMVRNELHLVDVVTGCRKPLRADKQREESPIEVICVSQLRQYFIILFRDQPFELWDLRKLICIRTMAKNLANVTALTWAVSEKRRTHRRRKSETTTEDDSETMLEHAFIAATTEPRSIREKVAFSDNDNNFYWFMVEGNTIKDVTKVPHQPISITALAWKGDMMVSGDVEGNLSFQNMRRRVAKTVSTRRGWVIRLVFAPQRGNLKVAVQFNDCVQVWDALNEQMVGSVICPKQMPRIHSLDWASSQRLLLAHDDGCVRLVDLQLNVVSGLLHADPTFFCPALCNGKDALNVKYHLQHQPWNDGLYQMSLSEQQSAIPVSEEMASYLASPRLGVAERCLIVAAVMGDESDYQFWLVVLYCLKKLKWQQLEEQGTLTPEWREKLKREPLAADVDLLMEKEDFEAMERDRMAVQESKRTTYEQTRRCVHRLILLGQKDRAIQLLYETPPEHASYVADSLKACLVASLAAGEGVQSHVKLVATNFIISGMLTEGIELLRLIDMQFQACRYLQDNGRWEQSAWLAKVSLGPSEYGIIMNRIADYWCTPQVSLKSRALLLLLTLNNFPKLVEHLFSMRQFDRAVLLIEACREMGVEPAVPEPLREAAYLQFARLLMFLSNYSAARYYARKAGEKGQLLLEEITLIEQGGKVSEAYSAPHSPDATTPGPQVAGEDGTKQHATVISPDVAVSMPDVIGTDQDAAVNSEEAAMEQKVQLEVSA